jgi:hypothetical protein
MRCQGREFVVDRPTIEFTWMVAAGDFPLLLVDIIDEPLQFLTRVAAPHGLILPAILHEGARAAAVLRRRRALPRNADRVTPGWIDRQGCFNPNVVNPAVAKIVFVGKALHPAQPQIANPYLSGIGIKEYAAISAQSVFAAADLKTVQVHILPAEGDLQYPVKLRDNGVTRHQQPSPNQRTDAAEHGSQLKNQPH